MKLLNTLIKQKLLFGFMFLMTMGLLFDTCDRINKYGWEYEYNMIINHEMKTYSFSGKGALIFNTIYLMFTLLCVSVILDLNRIKD